ncbi:hypothetical protein ACJVDH_00785 [Pedobacter sp. AW1-32]|uniref:hypothetical protein n=1 Tax=Pedobacter sp. AW1-32 TaxID=3383026 RepID=UPI003FEEDFB7
MNKIVLLLFACILLISCSHTNNEPIIKFSGDQRSVVINNIDETSLYQAKKAFVENPDSNGLIAVFEQPAEMDSIQTERKVNGKIKWIDDALIFTPDTTFVTGKSYLIENYIGVMFGTTKKLLQNAVKPQLNPQRQILTR